MSTIPKPTSPYIPIDLSQIPREMYVMIYGPDAQGLKTIVEQKRPFDFQIPLRDAQTGILTLVIRDCTCGSVSDGHFLISGDGFKGFYDALMQRGLIERSCS